MARLLERVMNPFPKPEARRLRAVSSWQRPRNCNSGGTSGSPSKSQTSTNQPKLHGTTHPLSSGTKPFFLNSLTTCSRVPCPAACFGLARPYSPGLPSLTLLPMACCTCSHSASAWLRSARSLAWPSALIAALRFCNAGKCPLSV